MSYDYFANAAPYNPQPHVVTFRLEGEKGRLHVSGSNLALDIRSVRRLIERRSIPADLDLIVYTDEAPCGIMQIYRGRHLGELIGGGAGDV